MIYMVMKSKDPMKRIADTALCSFQFYPKARIDNTCQFILNELCCHNLFSFALCGRMRWSKMLLKNSIVHHRLFLGLIAPTFVYC